MSESESLELLWVTDADTGVYILTVNTGNRRLRKEFNVTVLTATTTTRTGERLHFFVAIFLFLSH